MGLDRLGLTSIEARDPPMRTLVLFVVWHILEAHHSPTLEGAGCRGVRTRSWCSQKASCRVSLYVPSTHLAGTSEGALDESVWALVSLVGHHSAGEESQLPTAETALGRAVGALLSLMGGTLTESEPNDLALERTWYYSVWALGIYMLWCVGSCNVISWALQ